MYTRISLLKKTFLYLHGAPRAHRPLFKPKNPEKQFLFQFSGIKCPVCGWIGVFRYDPLKRMTPAEAMQHPWIRQAGTKSETCAGRSVNMWLALMYCL